MPDALTIDVALGARSGRPSLEVSFDANPGVSVLFGPSGAGKTTCLALIAGLLEPDRGRIELAGEVLFDSAQGLSVPPHLRRVGMLFQSLALFPHMSALDNVAYGLTHQARKPARRASALAWLERMRVAHVAERRPHTLSGGEAQRVALARALARGPRVLLLDEPFTALHEELRAELGREVVAIVKELGIPSLLVTHDRDAALALGEHVFLLERGRIIARGGLALLQRA